MWIYYSGHAVERGNEITDRLASTMKQTGTITMGKEEVVKKIYECMLVHATCTAESSGARLKKKSCN